MREERATYMITFFGENIQQEKRRKERNGGRREKRE